MNYLIQSFKTIDGDFYWRLKGKNKQILATSEMYTKKEMCFKTAKKLAKALGCELIFEDLNKDFE